MRRAGRIGTLLKVVAIYVALGPPLGALIMFLCFAAISVSQTSDWSGLAWIPLFGLIYGVPLSYLIGIGPATVAGLVVGVRSAFYGPTNWLFAALTGLGVGLGLLYMGGHSIASVMEGKSTDIASGGILIATCFGATMLCWIVAKIRFSPGPVRD